MSKVCLIVRHTIADAIVISNDVSVHAVVSQGSSRSVSSTIRRIFEGCKEINLPSVWN